MGKNIRVTPGYDSLDPSNITRLEYNNPAGAIKTAEVGRSLIPLKYVTGGSLVYTTNATTAIMVEKLGLNLAIYNNSGSVGSITLGPGGAGSTPPTSLAPGVTSGSMVGIPCAPNSWTYIAMNQNQYVIASAATLLVFAIEDITSIQQEFSQASIMNSQAFPNVPQT
jgi:hypothetical protein